MEFLFGLVVGIVLYHLFNNPEKTKALREDIKAKIEEHKKAE